MSVSEPVLQSRPAEVVEIDGGALLVRGSLALRFVGNGILEALQILMTRASAGGVARTQLIGAFAAPQRPVIERLIDHLLKSGVFQATNQPLSQRAEDSLDIFYWDVGYDPAAVRSRLSQRSVSILGVNGLTGELAGALIRIGTGAVQVVDEPVLRNLRFFTSHNAIDDDAWAFDGKPLPSPISLTSWIEGGTSADGVIVAASDFGGSTLLRKWNQYAVEQRRDFLPIVLDHVRATIGPLVVPGETPCFECFRARENALLRDPVAQRLPEAFVSQTQSAKGLHPSLAAVAAHTAALELTRLYAFRDPAAVGRVLEIDFLTAQTFARNVLWLPRCPVCAPGARGARTAIGAEANAGAGDEP